TICSLPCSLLPYTHTYPLRLISLIVCSCFLVFCFFFFSSRRRHTRCYRDWSSDVCSSDLPEAPDKRRGRTISSSARGARPSTHHGPLQRLLDAFDLTVTPLRFLSGRVPVLPRVPEECPCPGSLPI